MIPAKPPAGSYRFRIVGGGLQLQIANASDLASVLKLDEAHWAMTMLDMDSLRMDRRFLELVDSDHDGQIRSGEVKDAVQYTLKYLRDLTGTVNGSGELFINSINPEAAGAGEIIDCAKLILRNIGKTEDCGLTAGDICSSGNVTGFSRRNGDGIISSESNLSETLQTQITAIIASGRKSKDLSGNDGVSMPDVEGFEAAVAGRVALFDMRQNDPSIMICGEKTPEVNALFRECESLIEGYFLNTEAGKFILNDPERSVRKEFSADLMVPANVRQALANAAAAIPGNEDGLDFSAPLNPLYADKLRALAALPEFGRYMNGSILRKENFLAAKADLASFDRWQKAFSADDGLEGFSEADLRKFAAGNFVELKELIKDDLSMASVVNAGESLLKIILFQQYLVEFLNNFVSLSSLFNPQHPSQLQMGKLVMDGRHFTLAVKVKNPTEHKKIIKSSNICVIYVEIYRQNGQNSEKQLLAVAVTSGTMRSLFVGKHGIFFDTDGVIYNAVIRDIAEQPVSIGEAFKAPFFHFADFFSKQAEKIFNSRNAEMQKSLTAEMNKSQLAAAPKVNPGGTAPAVAPQSGGMGNISMLLMGGGIGVAALGSSIAFIAKSLQNVSFMTIFAVLLGIIVIFGGPSVIIALIKLCRRNLSRFLESCGCAVNRPMRMSRRMGDIFTFVPKRPKGEITLLDPVDVFYGKHKKQLKKLFIWLLILLLLAAVVWTGRYFYLKRHSCKNAAVETVNPPAANGVDTEKKVCPVENNKPSAGKENKPVDNQLQGDKENASPVA